MKEDLKKESLELMKDKKFMRALKRSKEQIEKREFADWEEITKDL